MKREDGRCIFYFCSKRSARLKCLLCLCLLGPLIQRNEGNKSHFPSRGQDPVVTTSFIHPFPFCLGQGKLVQYLCPLANTVLQFAFWWACCFLCNKVLWKMCWREYLSTLADYPTAPAVREGLELHSSLHLWTTPQVPGSHHWIGQRNFWNPGELSPVMSCQHWPRWTNGLS